MTDTQNPTGTIFAALTDLNGVWRGKRLQGDQAAKIAKGGVRMPLSVCGLDIWGEDITLDQDVLSTGDGDGVCLPTGRGPIAFGGAGPASVLWPLWMHHEDGTPCAIDPRQALAATLARFGAAGLTPVVATELEFYLYDPANPHLISQASDRLDSDRILALDDLVEYDPVINGIYAACESADIPADSAIAEGGPGQFEINLNHVPDPMKAADDAVLFKQIVRMVARQHGLGASFMAKPMVDRAGSGLHVHLSLLDGQGRNIFDDGTDQGSPVLGHAVAGLLGQMASHTLIWAPHGNSYRRFRPGSHAPSTVSWAYENRSTAVRVPGGAPGARRIEHRVAGADANPYLVLAAVLGAVLDGIEAGQPPAQPVQGNAHTQPDLPRMPDTWPDAVEAFAAAPGFDPALITALTHCKRQEIARFQDDISAFEYQTYLGNL